MLCVVVCCVCEREKESVVLLVKNELEGQVCVCERERERLNSPFGRCRPFCVVVFVVRWMMWWLHRLTGGQEGKARAWFSAFAQTDAHSKSTSPTG